MLTRAIQACESETTTDTLHECVFKVIESEMREKGIPAAFDAFKIAYETHQAFAEGGCHARAHRMGDLAYYNVYFESRDLQSLEFPQETTACGYGFFHGFLEHYVQDTPTTEAVTEVCDYLVANLSDRMGDIQAICYHGAGHGLTLAQAEKVPVSEYGNSAAFVTEPARQCASLPNATKGDIEQCYEGIYNIIVDYMMAKEYGFTYTAERPFDMCVHEPRELWEGCMYEMAQKIEGTTQRDPAKMVDIVSQIPDERLQTIAFSVGIAGVVQQVAVQESEYLALLGTCAQIERRFFENCVKSIVWGLYEHGDPQDEYRRVIAFCNADVLRQDGDMRAVCFKEAARRLERLYATEKIKDICAEYPAEFQDMCVSDALRPRAAR